MKERQSEKGMVEFITAELVVDVGSFHGFLCMTYHFQEMSPQLHVMPPLLIPALNILDVAHSTTLLSAEKR